MFNMKMIVWFGVDPCLPSLDSRVITMSDNLNRLLGPRRGAQKREPSASTLTTSPAINIFRAGTQVPQDALVEMILRSVFYLRVDWNELCSALSQTLSLGLSVHERGRFTEMRELKSLPLPIFIVLLTPSHLNNFKGTLFTLRYNQIP
jgi:hypothetical protein